MLDGAESQFHGLNETSKKPLEALEQSRHARADYSEGNLGVIQWAIQDLTFSRGARLITGRAPTDFNFNTEVSQMRRTPETKPEPVNAPH